MLLLEFVSGSFEISYSNGKKYFGTLSLGYPIQNPQNNT